MSLEQEDSMQKRVHYCAVTLLALAAVAPLVYISAALRESSVSSAQEEIAKFGGTIQVPGYNSRYVFENQNLSPADLAYLSPFFKTIPLPLDVNPSLRTCRVLDVTSAKGISEVDALNLVRELDNTTVFSTKYGRPAKAMTTSLRRQMDEDARTTR